MLASTQPTSSSLPYRNMLRLAHWGQWQASKPLYWKMQTLAESHSCYTTRLSTFLPPCPFWRTTCMNKTWIKKAYSNYKTLALICFQSKVYHQWKTYLTQFDATWNNWMQFTNHGSKSKNQVLFYSARQSKIRFVVTTNPQPIFFNRLALYYFGGVALNFFFANVIAINSQGGLDSIQVLTLELHTFNCPMKSATSQLSPI